MTIRQKSAFRLETTWQPAATAENPVYSLTLSNLSAKTVGTYRARILEKTGWRNNTELTKYCVQHGLTDIQ